MQFLSSHQFYWELVGGVTATSVMLFRDSEWFHFVASYDGNESTNADKLKVYINGEEIELTFAGTLPTTPQHFGDTILHTIGANTSVAAVIDGLMTQAFHVADASIQNGDHAITDFGESVTVGDNGSIWAPVSDAAIKSLVDAGGTNSFLLSSAFGDGTDDSAKGNDWTPTSMSDAANGSGDTPSNPYALFSELTCTTTSLTIAEGGLNLTSTNASFQKPCLSSFGMQTGKWFWMCEIDAVANSYPIVGLSVAGQRLGSFNVDDYIAVRTSTGTVVHTTNGGAGTHNGTAHGLTITTGTVVAFAFDADTRTIWFGTVSGSTITWDGDPEAGTGGYLIDNEAAGFVTLVIWNNGGSGTMRAIYDFGQNGFALTGSTVTPPTGFNPQQPRYLPAPTAQGADVFNAVLYSGDGVPIGSGGNAITGAGFQTDAVWLAERNNVHDNHLYDSSRGATLNLEPNNTNFENTESEGLTSFDSDGFTVGSDSDHNQFNQNYVAWCWKLAGGTETTNNDGSVTTTVQSNEFMSLIRWQSPNASGAAYTIGHGLTSPDLLILRPRDAASSWYTAGKTTPLPTFAAESGFYVVLDLSNAVFTDGLTSGLWTTSTFSGATDTFQLGATSSVVQGDDQMLALAFKNIPGLCHIGEYTGNASTDGPFIHTGFRPRWIVIKGSNNASYRLYDTERDAFNESDTVLYADLTSVEQNTSNIDILANGFKLRTSPSSVNGSGTKYMYIAIADVASGSGLPPIPGR